MNTYEIVPATRAGKTLYRVWVNHPTHPRYVPAPGGGPGHVTDALWRTPEAARAYMVRTAPDLSEAKKVAA